MLGCPQRRQTRQRADQAGYRRDAPNTFVAFHGEAPSATLGLADPVLPGAGLADAVLPVPGLAPLDTKAVPTMNTMTPISRRAPPAASSQRAACRRLRGEDPGRSFPPIAA